MLSWLALQSYQGSLGIISPWTGLAYFGLPLASAGLLSLGWPALAWGGGLIPGGGGIGRWLTGHFQPVFNLAGSLLLFTAVALASFMGITRLSYVALLSRLGDWVNGLGRSRPRTPLPDPEPDFFIERKPPTSKAPVPEIAHPSLAEIPPTITTPPAAHRLRPRKHVPAEASKAPERQRRD